MPTMAMGALAAAVLVVAIPTWMDQDAVDDPADTPAGLAAKLAVEQYDAALQPLLRNGGQVVAEGLKPGVGDVANDAFIDEVLVRMTSGWLASLQAVSADVAALPVPSGLADVAVRYERSLRTYVRAAEALAAAAKTDGAERAALVERAAQLGRTADQLFDDAKTALDRHRAHAVVPTTAERGTR